MRPSRRVLPLLALSLTLSCSADRASNAPRLVSQYVTFEYSRVLWPLSYYSDAQVVHFLYSEYLTFDDAGKVLTRESHVLTHDLVTGATSTTVVQAHMSVQRRGNTLLLGAPDVCPPHADCTAGRLLRIPDSGRLIEAPGRFGADSLVFGPLPMQL